MAKKKGKRAAKASNTNLDINGETALKSDEESLSVDIPNAENVQIVSNVEGPTGLEGLDAANDLPLTPKDQITMQIEDEETEVENTLPVQKTEPNLPEEKVKDDLQADVLASNKQDVNKLVEVNPEPVGISSIPDVDSLQTDDDASSNDEVKVTENVQRNWEKGLSSEAGIEGNQERPVPATPVLTEPTPASSPVAGIPVTPENTTAAGAHEALKKEEIKVESAIESFNAPPLPSRDRVASQEVIETPSLQKPASPAVTQSPISPPLPRRTSKKHSVPPPLHEELQSEKFKQNMAMSRSPPPPPPRMNNQKRVESAADVSLIVNRFRQTSHHYHRQDEQSREDLERGKDLLKSSYSTFLESLPVTATPKHPLGDEDEHIKTEEELSDLHDDEKALVKIDWAYWTQVVNDFPSVASDPEKLEREITGGIPPQIRGIIWQLIANSKSKEFEDIYLTLLDTESPHEASIQRDLKRTKFIPANKVESLYRVMKVYSVYDPDVGYTQGMAFIATPLIMNCETEADSFGLLIRLMKSYGLRELFLPDMPGLMLLLYQFDRLFEENSPQLYNHLTRQGVRSSMYATQWFLTFFAYRFPLAFVLRIFDIVFVEGIESVLRIAVNLMLKNSEQLLQLKFDKLLDFLKNELFAYYLKHSVKEGLSPTNSQDDDSDKRSVLKKDISINHHAKGEPLEIADDDYDIDAFVQDAMNDVHVTPLSLKRYAAEYEEIHEIEQQKEAQYESIRIKNNQLQLEVRKLERDYTILNREHVEIANELIKNRLKIETLLDENNDQKSMILTLRKELEEEKRKQQLPNPDAGIPSDLREDLDRTIRRNAEVMDANLKMQDKINELERVVELLKAGNRAGSQNVKTSKPPIANAFSKLFKNDS